jgi:hypothetical protein
MRLHFDCTNPSYHVLYALHSHDRRILRFYRGFNEDVSKAALAYSTFLKWRKDNNIDVIRDDIISGKTPCPSQFPNGEKILAICPQIVLSTKHRDKHGRPIALERYDFPMKEFLEKIPLEEFYLFLLYVCEYRSMVLEQLSDEYEREYLRKHPDPKSRKSPYGVLLGVCSIRDLRGTCAVEHPCVPCTHTVALLVSSRRHDESSRLPWTNDRLRGLEACHT